MKLLSALNNEEIEDYIRLLPEIEAVITVKDPKTLIDSAASDSYDLVLISTELAGSEEMEDLIEVLSSEVYKRLRIVFVYGEYDAACNHLIGFLLSHGIYDFHVGTEITSKDIERLIFRPAEKETALRYFKSCYNESEFLNRKERSLKRNRCSSGTAPYLRIPFEKAVISIISNHATGKSHTAWNLSSCCSKRGYATSLFNIDRGYSANLYFDIDEIFYDLLDYTLKNDRQKDILDICCRRKNLSIITGRLGDEKELSSEDFLNLLYSIRTKSDVTLIDTRTGLSALTRASVKSSIYDLLIFDCDVMHFHMNMKMLEELKDDFVPEKTIAVINNTNVKSSSHKFIYNELINTGIPFKGIAFISSCSHLSYEIMHTGLTPYQKAGDNCKGFANDIDNLLDLLFVIPGKPVPAGRIYGRKGGRFFGLL